MEQEGYMNEADYYAKYQGCRNCEYQPAPLMVCKWLKTQTVVFVRCPRWEERKAKNATH
jgi:hypothetical protein